MKLQKQLVKTGDIVGLDLTISLSLFSFWV